MPLPIADNPMSVLLRRERGRDKSDRMGWARSPETRAVHRDSPHSGGAGRRRYRKMIGAEECHLPETVGVWGRLQGLVLRFGDTGVFCSELVARLDVAPWKTPRSAVDSARCQCSEARSTCCFALGQ